MATYHPAGVPNEKGCGPLIAVIILILLSFASFGQAPFKPGAYTAGQQVVDIYGTVWEAKVNIGNAVSPPSANRYWVAVSKAEPIPIDTEPSNQIPGLSTTNLPEANSRAIETFLNAIPEGATPSVYIPRGEYHLARTITIYKRPIYLYGDNGTIFGNSTKLYFPAGVNGIYIDRGGTSLQETIIERICVIAKGKTSLVDGIAIRARVKIRDCTVKGFANNGIGIWAVIEEGSDASGSIIESCHVLECGNDGFFIGRTDGNAITVINSDARDCGRYGFNEDSFLGNTYIGTMAHNNRQGDYHTRDWGNNRSTFVSIYSEGGSPLSSFGPLNTIIGGIFGTGYTIGSDPKVRNGSYIPNLNQ